MKKFTLLSLKTLIICLVCSTAIHAQSTAIYNVTYQSTWNASEHSSIPSSDHYSNLVGATHKNENEYFEIGQLASNGIKKVAELGENTVFMNEVQSSSNTKEWFNVPFSPNNALGTATISNIEVSEDKHLLTLVSMIAPSPDWFIAVNSLDLRNVTNTTWKPTFTVDVFVYDAGTDSGTNYSSANAPTSSPENIYMNNGFPINGNKVGTLTIEYVSTSLSVADFEIENELKLFPNPSKGNFSIIGESVSKLKAIEVYNILGSKVKTIKVSTTNTRLELNFLDLNKGLYLVKLYNENGNSKTHKLVLQ